jgi:hypothetical protein
MPLYIEVFSFIRAATLNIIALYQNWYFSAILNYVLLKNQQHVKPQSFPLKFSVLKICKNLKPLKSEKLQFRTRKVGMKEFVV